MLNNVCLPSWLDQLIFTDLKANYCRSNSDMTVIDWDKKDVLNYLGTYFPRSYTEAYCIFDSMCEDYQMYLKDCCHCHRCFFDLKEIHIPDWFFKNEISVFDFGCGTGGEIIGMLDAICQCMPHLKKVSITAFDGNYHALRLFEKIIKNYSPKAGIDISYKVIPFEIDDFYDMTVLDSIISDEFDIIMTFKAICEFVTKDRFEQENAYTHFAKSFLPKLTNDGIMVITDVTTYNNVSQEWLPKMMDRGLNEAGCNIIGKNEGYNQAFKVSHSRCRNDVSKIAWRII